MTKQPSLNPSYCIGHLEHELHQTFALSHLKNHGFEQYKQETLCEQLDSYYDEINDGHYSIQVNFNENQIQGKPLILEIILITLRMHLVRKHILDMQQKRLSVKP